MPSDIEIAQRVQLKPIVEIAEKLGLQSDQLEYYGKYKAKLPLDLIDLEKVRQSRLILVSAISPTPAGEGKTTVSIGLAQAMNRQNMKTTVVLREPSLGPVFGIKGGATGGGHSQVLPMEDINLHFTGDFAAIEKAHNLLSALIDNNIQSKNRSLGIDPRTVEWKRVVDMNDRALRQIVVGLGGTGSGVPRETGFDITAASEIMAILCLSDDLQDLKKRFGNIFVGFSFTGQPIYARDLNAHGAMAALMKDAIKPNLVQTIEGTPAVIHGGPFANIAQGTNSIIATRMGMTLSDYVVTEAGFGFDLGAEKFIDIKCQYGQLDLSAVVLVATVRALKYHGGASLNELTKEDLGSLEKGLANLEKHVENIKQFNAVPIVAINRFTTDTDDEVELIRSTCDRHQIKVAPIDVWKNGGSGALNLADIVNEVCSNDIAPVRPMYDWSMSIPDKIEAVARKIYGANAIDFTTQARKDLRKIEKLGLNELPVCIAKTQKSLSDNPKLIGRPKDFVVTVRRIEIASGAGFVIPITGDIMRMPGLPAVPSAENIDIDNEGRITGLF